MQVRTRFVVLLSMLLLSLALLLTACGGGGGSDQGAAPGPSAGGSSGGPAGGGDASGGPAPGDPEAGKAAFTSSCSSCHGMDGRGMPGIGKDLVNPSDWMKQQSDADLVTMIKQGRPVSDPENTTGVDMPPKGGNPALTDQDIVNIVAYLRSVQQ